MAQAAKAYEKHREANGHFESHAKAKEFLYAEYFLVFRLQCQQRYRAGTSGVFIDRMVETKGLNFIDKEKAKHHGDWSHLYWALCWC